MEQLTKLRPDRDLQCYFERPSAIAAMSGASPDGFVVSGSWRQQFDWVVVEWNRDNVFEHPALRNLPDGNLSGLRLSYEEQRTNCIPLDSTLYPTVDWPYLRIWAGSPEALYQVRLKDYATPVAGSYAPATIEFELQGTVTPGDYIELAWLDQHFNYQIATGDTAASAVAALAGIITAFQSTSGVGATAAGNRITLIYTANAGTNANRIGVYGMVHGARTETWSPAAGLFGGGTSPTRWKVDLNFGNLYDVTGAPVPTTDVRKMRWTWAADLQPGNFQRSEFAVAITNWSVSGTGLVYRVASRGSRRIEDDSADLHYLGAWSDARGNFSGGSIHWSVNAGASVSCTYQANDTHTLLLGTRLAESAGRVDVVVDGGTPKRVGLYLNGEDVLVRAPIGQFGPGEHTVTVTHTGSAGSYFYFDYFEIAYPATGLPDFLPMPTLTLATDWDTDHSLALPPERTAWMIHKLGFHGRCNHYVGTYR